jgi:hypothetical protein
MTYVQGNSIPVNARAKGEMRKISVIYLSVS